MNKFNRGLCTSIVLLLALPVAGDDRAPYRVTVKEIMDSVITPATNTLWGAEDPQTDAAWKQLEDAAITTILAGHYIGPGGADSSNNERATTTQWRAFNAAMIQAATDALRAIRERDIDALFVANDVLYPPCEGCHVVFVPGTQ